MIGHNKTYNLPATIHVFNRHKYGNKLNTFLPSFERWQKLNFWSVRKCFVRKKEDVMPEC